MLCPRPQHKVGQPVWASEVNINYLHTHTQYYIHIAIYHSQFNGFKWRRFQFLCELWLASSFSYIFESQLQLRLQSNEFKQPTLSRQAREGVCVGVCGRQKSQPLAKEKRDRITGFDSVSQKDTQN